MSPAPHSRSEAIIERVPLAAGRPLVAYGVSLALVAASAALRMMFDPLLPPGFPYITFFPAVALSAFLFGLRPGILTALLSGLIAWGWFIPPGGFPVHAGAITALSFYLLVTAIELSIIHLMQVANARLARERERSRELADSSATLFSELQHRVSNNLQVTAALLSLQRQKLSDEGARAAIDEAARRLALIGKISRQLYDPNGGAKDMSAFLTDLSRDVVEALGRPEIEQRIVVDGTVSLPPDAAIPLALIMTEAVSNAVEHGIAPGMRGCIDVTLTRVGNGHVRLDVADDGMGLADDFDLARSDSLGLRIATTLARQLHGSFELMPRRAHVTEAAQGSGGTVARLTFAA